MNNVFNVQKDTIHNDLIIPIIPDRFDVCPYCKSQRIELFSFNGYPQHYNKAVEAYLRGYIVSYDKYEIRTMKCRSCGKEFVIDWSIGFPVPLRSSYKTNKFLEEFYIGI